MLHLELINLLYFIYVHQHLGIKTYSTTASIAGA